MPKLPRPTSEQDRLELKTASRHALEMARASKFAMVTRVEAPALSKYGDPFNPDAFMPIDVALDLDRDIGSPMLLAALAELEGYELTPASATPARGVGVEDLATVAKETGDVIQTLAAALADGIDSHERRALRREIAEAIRALRALDRNLAGE